MKTKINFTLLLLIIGIHAIHAHEWGYVNTLTDEWLRKICTQGLDTVYIAGENGLIAQSTDQGETWNKQYFPTGVALNDIIFTDHYTGFAAGEQGTILKTTDAGENWIQVTSGFTSNINAIAATGPNNIWAVGDNSLVLHSVDGGYGWEQINILPENDRQLSDIEFRDNLGYFTGNYATVYKTEDLGATWVKQNIVTPNHSVVGFHAINMMENKTYLMHDNDLYSTEDQIHWNKIGYPLPLANPFFANSNTGYIVGAVLPVDYSNNNSGFFRIVKTVNGGVNWELDSEINIFIGEQHVGGPEKIMIVNDTIAYAILGQVLLKTPAPTPLYYGIEKFKNGNVLKILRTGQNELLLQSDLYPILLIEMLDISGKKLINKQWQNPVKEIKVDINNLFEGVYLIKATHNDHTISISKYVKR
jgi:hypothetical protein